MCTNIRWILRAASISFPGATYLAQVNLAIRPYMTEVNHHCECISIVGDKTVNKVENCRQHASSTTVEECQEYVPCRHGQPVDRMWAEAAVAA